MTFAPASIEPRPRLRIDWLDPLRAFALFGVILNHLVEEFGSGPWFTNPSNNWPDFATRMSRVFPSGSSLPVAIVQFLGWLGDSAPGVFILVSGVGLTLSVLNSESQKIDLLDFFKRRVLRIFPLYIAMHFLILAGSLAVPGSTLSFASRKTLLSVLGLRFTDSLFFYISPAWWFIWLILQLYCVFPFLFKLLQRTGLKRFLAITLTITFASRLLGILYSQQLYFWMTGIFFATRLAEFCAGMAIAAYLYKLKQSGRQITDTPRVLSVSVGAYVMGLLCSFTLPGSIVSNLLVTIGMSGLFYVLWQGVKSNRALTICLTWIGVESFAVYLLHHTPLKWTRVFFPGNVKLHLFAAVLILIASFPAGWAINKGVSRLPAAAKALAAKGHLRRLALLAGISTVLALVFIQPFMSSDYRERVFALMLALVLVVELYAEYASGAGERAFERLVRWAVIAASMLQLYILPPGLAIVSLATGVFLALLSMTALRLLKSRALAWATALGIALLAASSAELVLRQIAPLESGRWGEFPALQEHPTRVYGLKPNRVTPLRYNNYDYTLKTNSLGLASPEITIDRPTSDTLRILAIGDAFTMPEGVDYEYSYPHLLERALSDSLAPRHVQVINAGVTGYGPAEEHPQLAELAPLLRPDIVVYEFFINEFDEASISAEDRLRSIGLRPEPRSRVMREFNQSQVLAHFRKLNMRLGELVSGKPGAWRRGKALLDYYRTGENPIYSAERIARVRADLKSMVQVCGQAGAAFVIYFVPGSIAVSKSSDIAYYPWNEDLSDRSEYDLERPLRTLQGIAQELGIAVIDLTPYLRNGPTQPVYFPESWHWNKEGHKVVAAAIADTLLDRQLIQRGSGRGLLGGPEW